MSLHHLLGSGPDSATLQNWLQTLIDLIPGVADREIRPEVKAYKTTVYHNYPALGISLEFIQDSVGGLALDAIHVYNRHEKHKNDATSFSSYPGLPIVLPAGGPLEASPSMTAKDFVQALGEPSKKGGGTGLSSGSINIWCEWNSCGVMVEFGGPESRGHDAWDRGREAIWKEITLFKPFIST